MSGWLNVPKVQGTILLADTFSYADGSLVTNSSFAWNTHSGTAGQTQLASGKVQLQSSSGQTEDVNALLNGQPYAAAGSTNVFYAGFTVRFTALPTAGGDYFAHFNTGSSFRARIWALTGGATAGALRLGISSTTSTINATNTTELNLNTDYRVVTRLANTNCIGTLWINPTAETDPSVSTSEGTATVSISAYAFRQPGSTGFGTLTIDNLIVSTTFADVVTNAPAITTQPTNQTATVGDTVTFSVVASGNPPPTYQWQFNSTNLPSETNTSLTLPSVTTNNSGSYLVVVSNSVALTNSQTATLTVNPPAPPNPIGFSIVTYNTHGNGITNWTTNSLQVQAIARQLQYLNPDIITLNEIPNAYSYEMTNFVTAFFPGYSLARNSGTDNFIRSVILSRYPITRSTSWLDGAQLEPWGYTNANFTRDLFEAQITVPNFAQPLHVFVTHLKSSAGGYTTAAAKRAAEAAAITNFFATNLFVLYPLHPYLLAGDMNDADTNAGTNTLMIERLTSPPAGLQLTNPTNPFTGKINTYSIQTSSTNPTERIDYIFPGGVLTSNVISSQVFRSDKLTSPPAPLLTTDDVTASDHLPVMMTFANPYTRRVHVSSLAWNEPALTVQWNSVFGGTYRVETSTNLTAWTVLATGLTATNASYTYTTNITGNPRFFRIRSP